MPIPDVLRLQHRVYTVHAPLLNAVGNACFAAASRGKIIKVTLTNHGALTGSTALTMAIAGTAVTHAATTLTGALGTTATIEPTAANICAAGDLITLSWAAGATGAFPGTWVVTIREF